MLMERVTNGPALRGQGAAMLRPFCVKVPSVSKARELIVVGLAGGEVSWMPLAGFWAGVRQMSESMLARPISSA